MTKVVILAGGEGSRLAEETSARPKALVEIGGRPILWHIMRSYRHFGFKTFLIALGHKGEMIQTYIRSLGPSDGQKSSHKKPPERIRIPSIDGDWIVELIDTGSSTATGGRLRRIASYLENETFMLTWCDGLADIDLSALLAFHRAHGKLATLTAVHPPERFGVVALNGEQVVSFHEKPIVTDRWINGAFFVLEPEVLDYIESDGVGWEAGPLQRLAAEGQLMAFRHTGFWQCMDTLHEKQLLDNLCRRGNPPWHIGSKR